MLNYEYIQQLLERYWECQTTLEEEAILRQFFAQDNVPVELLRYRQIFLYQHEEPKAEGLGSDFDDRMMQMIEEQPTVKARTISLTARLRPLLHAAAIVAVLITIGTAVDKAISSPDAAYPTISPTENVTQKEAVARADSSSTVAVSTQTTIIE